MGNRFRMKKPIRKVPIYALAALEVKTGTPIFKPAFGEKLSLSIAPTLKEPCADRSILITSAL